MNRLLFTILSTLIALQASLGQSTYWTEEFNTPEGWTLEDNWSIAEGLLEFSWDPTIYNFDQEAVSPFITLDDHVTGLSVNQSLLVYNPSEDETAQLIITSEGEDYVIWEYNLLNGNWGFSTGSDTTFPLESFSGKTIQLKFRTFGATTFNWSSWQIFKISIHAQYSYDLMSSNIMGPNNIELLQQADWLVEVTNKGSEVITGYTVNLLDSKSGMVVDALTDSDPLATGESRVYAFSWTPNAAYNTSMYGQVVSTDDQFVTNNLSEGVFLRIEPDIDYSILVWDNDNGIQSIVCPENGDLVTPATGMTRALDDAGLEYDLVSTLPSDLDDYDVIIAVLGNYCLS